MSVTQNKFHIRLLPVFIFAAVLSLSIKINSVFDTVVNRELPKISISQNKALAEEKNTRETAQLTQILERSDSNVPVPTNNAPNNNFTQSEIAILQELAERREALDIRSQEIDKKAIQLKVAEDEIDKKLKQLREYENRLQKLINQYNDKEKAQLDSLVKMYSTMKPKDAARIFNTFELDILVAILKEMKPSTSSAILSQMNALKAKAVTTELLSRNI